MEDLPEEFRHILFKLKFNNFEGKQKGIKTKKSVHF